MTEDAELAEIREQKLEQLQEKAAEGRLGDGDDPDAGGDSTPTVPQSVDGAAGLDSLLDGHDVVLADFYADWCGPCKMLEPVVETIAAETDAAVAKVDVDANQPLAAEYGVRGVPTLVLFADGEPVERLVGVQDESRLRTTVESYT
jgi:thioredoxin 1